MGKDNQIRQLQKANQALKEKMGQGQAEATADVKVQKKYLNELLKQFKLIEDAQPLLKEIKKEMKTIRSDHMRFRELI